MTGNSASALSGAQHSAPSRTAGSDASTPPNWKALDAAAEFYNGAVNDYDLALDPRCLFGWGPPDRTCNCRFGHACFRALGHPGKCGETRINPLPCDRRQRPKDWDTVGRAEANR